MKNQKTESFNDDKLNSILKENIKTAEDRLRDWNKISSDITLMNNILSKYAVSYFCYVLSEKESLYFEDDFIWYKNEDFIRKLSECKIEIRVKMSEFFGDFFKGCLESIKKDKI